MDLGFLTAKPQSLLLTSLSSSSCSCSLSSTSFCFLQRDSFGWGHGLRPPGRGSGGSLRSQRKCRRRGALRLHSPGFVFRASIQPQSVLVVVAVVTFSAVSVVYYFNRRRKRNVKEVARRRFSANEEFQQDSFSELGDTLLDYNNKEIDGQGRDEGGLWESQESGFVHEEAPVTRALETSNVAVAETSSSSSFSEPAASSSVAVATESSGFNANGFGESAGIDPGMPPLFGSSSLQFNHTLLEVTQHNTVNEPGRETEFSSNFISAIHRSSTREGLYTFYEKAQPLTVSTAKLNGMRSISVGESDLESKRFSSLVRDAILNGADPQDRDSLQSSGKASVKGQVVRKGNQKKHMTGKGSLDSSQHFQPNGRPVNYKHQPSDKFTVYHYLVKDGRLSDCIQLLEDMEKEGILDMDKIYHARFYETCKRQKAVKEAFKFTKLIPNPTLSTFNMLMSVCSSSQDSEGAFEVLRLSQRAGLKADCKLYTNLISTCAKSGKVDTMFKVYHEMVNAGVEPNVHTYGALIDGCARAGQVAKAFGAYGIMRSKNVKPDRVVFNALISACGQTGAVDRAFDVLAEMRAETHPIDPDHVTVGALIKACANAGQVDRAREVYKMMEEYNIKGTPDVYTIAANCSSQIGDWDFACSVYADMQRKGVVPDEIFLSSLIDVAGHAGKIDAAFDILKEATAQGISPGTVLYSSLMGACSNAKNWEKALKLYKYIRSMDLKPTISTVNALLTALCDGNQLQKAMEVIAEMNSLGLSPNSTTYSILMGASERNDDLEVAVMLLSQAKKDGIPPSLVMCRCIIGMCLRRFEKACTLGEPVLSLDSAKPQLDNEWTSLALKIYRETIVAGVVPSIEVVSQVLGCLHLPYDASLKTRLIENLGVLADASRRSNLCSLLDGFGEYDPRAFSLFEEAASLGVVPGVSFKENPFVVDVRELQVHTAEVYLLTVLKVLKNRLAAGAKLPNVNILLPIENILIQSSKGEKTVTLSGRAGQAVASLLRRIGLPFHGNESYGKIRINGLALKRWFQPKLASPFTGEPGELSSPLLRLGKGISNQQRAIRTSDLSLE